jgi:hypothetical protein
VNPWLEWVKNVAVGCVGLFFLVQGLTLLRASYALRSPHEFIVIFFSSSLMILISAVAILYPLVRLALILKKWWPPRRDPKGTSR